ncbi:MAG: TetR/AcrR family transcriptional regulator [Chitinophagaceae bacterium]|nr:TetR/AcrR family transcriptional regulator [Chitinophagaceae bacterium]
MVNSTSQHIIVNAEKLFKQFGFKHVTMDIIAAECGISKKTLYENFDNKEKLVVETMTFLLKHNEESSNLIIENSKNAIEQMIGILHLMEKMNRGMNPVCILEMQKYFRQAYHVFEEYKENKVCCWIKENLKLGVEQELYRDDFDIDLMTRFRLESSFILFKTNLITNTNIDFVKANTQIFSNFMYGIATIKGHKLISKFLKNDEQN